MSWQDFDDRAKPEMLSAGIVWNHKSLFILENIPNGFYLCTLKVIFRLFIVEAEGAREGLCERERVREKGRGQVTSLTLHPFMSPIPLSISLSHTNHAIVYFPSNLWEVQRKSSTINENLPSFIHPPLSEPVWLSSARKTQKEKLRAAFSFNK